MKGECLACIRLEAFMRIYLMHILNTMGVFRLVVVLFWLLRHCLGPVVGGRDKS